MGLNDTPRADRLHIGIFGRRNSGKSSLINALTGQDTAIVSDTPGTTADPVFKAMEFRGAGPVVFIDTAGFDDDEGGLGRMRAERSREITDATDIAVIVMDERAFGDTGLEREWADMLASKNIPVIFCFNKIEKAREAYGKAAAEEKLRELAEELSVSEEGKEGGSAPKLIAVSAEEGMGIDALRSEIEKAAEENEVELSILGGLAKEGDLVMLVMPQDIQAPKGRLILPQVQTMRELLDTGCTAVASTADDFERSLASLKREPDLIITDSQCFGYVYERKPAASALTSFSVLFAAYKGDMDIFLRGASVLDELTEKSRILIAEACTHVPLGEDIGRVKIPALLRKKLGDAEIVNVCGADFPDTEGLKDFDLIIHCGACMFNRSHVLSRISQAEAAGVPITNYGIILAKFAGILDKIVLPRA